MKMKTTLSRLPSTGTMTSTSTDMKNTGLRPDTAARMSLYPTIRGWWNKSDYLKDFIHLLAEAEASGLPRQRIVRVLVGFIDPTNHRLDASAKEALYFLSKWSYGEYHGISSFRDKEYRNGTHIKMAINFACGADAWFSIANTARSSAELRDPNPKLLDEELCDVVRSTITVEEVCAALGLDPDAPVPSTTA